MDPADASTATPTGPAGPRRPAHPHPRVRRHRRRDRDPRPRRRRRDLDVIAITDHERIDAAFAARAMAQDRGLALEVVVGEEVTTLGGHLLALYLERRSARTARCARPSPPSTSRRDRHPGPPAGPVPAVRAGLRAPAAPRGPGPARPPRRDRDVNPTALGRPRHARVVRLRRRVRPAARRQQRRPRPRRDRLGWTSFPGRTAADLRASLGRGSHRASRLVPRRPVPSRRSRPSSSSQAASRRRLRSCSPEHPELAGRAVERAVLPVRARSRIAPQSSAVRPGNVVQPLPTARAAWASLLPTAAQAVLRRESDDPGMPRPAERRRVERLDRVGVDRGPDRRGAGGARSPGRTADTGRAGGRGSRCRPARGSRRSSSAACATSGPARSMYSARRWPPSVVTSSPTTTSIGSPRSRAIGRPATRGVDPLVVGDRDDVQVRRRPTCSRISVTAACRPRRACGCGGRRGRPAGRLGSRSGPGPPRVGRLGRRLRRVRPDREEHGPPLLGRVADHPLERGRRAPPSSPSTRSRRVPSAGTGPPEAARRSGRRPVRRDADDVDRRAGLDGEQRRPDRQPAGAPNSCDGDPAAGDVPVGDEPDRVAVAERRRAARGGPRAAPTIWTPTAPRVRTNQPWSAGSSMVSIGATAPPTLAARNSAGQLDGAEVQRRRRRPGRRTRRLARRPRASPRSSRSSRSSAPDGRASGRPRGSSARVWRNAARTSRSSAAGRSRRARTAASATTAARRGRRRPGAGSAAPGRRGRARGRYQIAGRDSASADQRSLGQVAGEPRRRDEAPARGRRRPGRRATRAASAASGHGGAPGGGPGSGCARPASTARPRARARRPPRRSRATSA